MEEDEGVSPASARRLDIINDSDGDTLNWSLIGNKTLGKTEAQVTEGKFFSSSSTNRGEKDGDGNKLKSLSASDKKELNSSNRRASPLSVIGCVGNVGRHVKDGFKKFSEVNGSEKGGCVCCLSGLSPGELGILRIEGSRL